METKYKQVRLKYATDEFEICWIPEQFSVESKKIVIGSAKSGGKFAVVLEVLGDKSYTKEYLELNKNHPLWKVTDI
jgi:hypothetical protein